MKQVQKNKYSLKRKNEDNDLIDKIRNRNSKSEPLN